MSSINPQIDAAVVLMKARAAEFDDEYDLVDTVDTADWEDLTKRADHNLSSALNTAQWHGLKNQHAQALARQSLLDTMNLCALALSVLPEQPVS